MTSPPTRMTFDELLDSTGRDLGVTEWHTITQADVTAFAELTQDRQWIHVDEDRARTGPFGTTVVHGFFTLSLLPYFLDQLLEVTDISMGVNYGLDKVRFPSAVPVGTPVRGQASITRVTPQGGDRAQIAVAMEFQTPGSDRPACVAHLIALFYR